MRNLLFIIATCLSFLALGQKKVYVTSSTGYPDYQGALFLTDVETCTSDFIGLTDELLFDIAINPMNNDMYGVGNNTLYKVDKTTAALTLIAVTSLSLEGLTFSSDGTLYTTGDGYAIYVVDTTDGSYDFVGPTISVGGHDLTFFNCLLTQATIYPDLSIVQGDPETFSNPNEIFYSPAPLFTGLSTLGCPPSIYGFSHNDDIWRFTEDLSLTEQVCSSFLPSEYHVSGSAAVYDETNCEFEQDGVVDMPNVFTPNLDNINDIFLPKETCGVESFNLQIFNRWGGVVFETDDITQGWDGNYKGENAVDGTYLWILEFTTESGVFNTSNGFVQLLR